MTERERLARIFGIEPMQPLGPIVIAVVMGFIPMMWIGSGALGFSLVAIYADERRKVQAGLAEVGGWGWPISGYREWLLAREPAFDVELRRDVAVDLIEAAVHAIDPQVVVERRGERVVRIVMARVEIHAGELVQTFLAGDRRRLVELRDRVLAPLHADVGITAMRMGDRSSLGALEVSPVSAHDGAFREQAKAAPPDLQSLVHAGTTQLRPPREPRSVRLRLARLFYATGERPTHAAWMTVAIGGLAVIAAPGGPIAVLIGALAGGLGATALHFADRSKLYKLLARASQWPFPVEGYDDWLLSGRPIMDVEFGSPPKRAEVERSLRGVARVADLTWLSDTLLRMESQPIGHQAGQGIMPFWGGDPRELQQVARRVLVPLHETHRIVAVRMGGYLDRRV